MFILKLLKEYCSRFILILTGVFSKKEEVEMVKRWELIRKGIKEPGERELYMSAKENSSKNAQNDDGDVVLERERIRRVYEFRTQIVKWFGLIFVVLSLAVPLSFVKTAVVAIAGRTTDVSVSFSFILKVSVVISIGSIVALITTLRKCREQKKELIRLRKRCDLLEEGGS